MKFNKCANCGKKCGLGALHCISCSNKINPRHKIPHTKETKEKISKILKEKGLEKWREEVKQIIKEVKENKYCKDESKKDLCFECKDISHTKEFYTNHFCNKLDDHIGKNWRINQDVDCNNCIYFTKKKEENNEN